MKNIEYFIGQKLYLEINMIGYKTMGESIILSLKSSDTTVLWTAVIDCYKYDNCGGKENGNNRLCYR